MKDNLVFNGFNSDAAKKSSTINRVLIRLINNAESDIKVVTSTPKSKGKRMEISFSKYYEEAAKYESNFHITMDYDSGYISHHQESNSNSSIENLSVTIANPSSSKPIYLSEDALLEKPEITSKLLNLTDEIEKEDFEETRIMFNTPESVISTSVISQGTNYSGFDNDSSSNKSFEVPIINQIIVENPINSPQGESNIENLYDHNEYNLSVNQGLPHKDIIDGNTRFFRQTDCLNRIETVTDDDRRTFEGMAATTNMTRGNFDYCKENLSLPQEINFSEKIEVNDNLALHNITNTCGINSNAIEKRKKLTLIFCKDNKENVYSVKRKYSITPDKGGPSKKLKPDADIENTIRLHEKQTQEKITDKLSLETNCNSNIAENAEIINSSSQKLAPENDVFILERIQSLENSVPVVPQENKLVLEEFFKQSTMPTVEKPTTPVKKYENPIDPNISPDLFVEEETIRETVKVDQPLNYIAEEKFIIKKDHRIIKRVQNGLKGVLPPLSVTVVQLSLDEILNRLESNKEYFWSNNCPIKSIDTENKSKEVLNISNESSVGEDPKSLLITAALSECVHKTWPKILEERCHGLHYNRSKLSEEFEELCTKYAQRYIGAETESSCTVFETKFVSPTKRKQMKQRWAVKSPGRRLSHLARRRITFSSANLQGGVPSVAGSRARQILVDAKKLDLLNRRRSPRKSPRKTPKKTPGKSPRLKSRTPTSSAKKKLAIRFRELAGEIEKTGSNTSSNNVVLSSKRALFQSPDRDKKSSLFLPSTSGLSVLENELKKPNTKRALFLSPSKHSPRKNSPFKRSPFKRLELGIEKKRKRSESEDTHPSKLPRSMSHDIRPSESEILMKFNRTKSDMNISLNRSHAGPSGELSAIHKKKLQWAVYEALRSQNITPCHAQFKVFASILARVTRRFLPNLTGNAPRPEGGTSERMLRIARHHVYAVVKGKSVDEIVSEYLKNRPKTNKPQGYVGIEEFYNEKRNETYNKENLIQGRINTLESLEKRKLEQLGKVGSENKIDRIRKVINFDNR